jgi:glycosyltransferase involved in cell wall biosynthesis
MHRGRRRDWSVLSSYKERRSKSGSCWFAGTIYTDQRVVVRGLGLISVLVLTKNEEKNLRRCLKCVQWCDDVHVLDSGSTDSTLSVAKDAGTRVTVLHSSPGREIFGGNEARHKNWALTNIPFKYQWVLQLDADECVTPELAASIRQATQNPRGNVAFRVRRRDFWGGRWLKHVQPSSYYLRLFRPDKIRYERLINPISIPDGPVGELSGYLDHYPFSKGMTHWVRRHNSYSTLEAQQIVTDRSVNRHFNLGKAFLCKDFNERRFHQKELFYRLPARPFLKFLLLYIGKRGFLDGRAGFRYAMLQAFYEYMIVLKTEESKGTEAVPFEVRNIESSPGGTSVTNFQ